MAIVALTACDGSGPRAHGALVLDLDGERLGADVIDAQIATEVEILTSAPLVERVAERLGLGHGLSAGETPVTLQRALRASRRGATLVIDVEVSHEDPRRAVEACSVVMETYLERRMELRAEPILRELEWLSVQRERLPEGEPRRQVEARLATLEHERAALTLGARVLERCTTG